MPENDEANVMQVRDGPLRDRIEAWRKKQDRVPPLSEALRRLLLLGLAADRAHKSAKDAA